MTADGLRGSPQKVPASKDIREPSGNTACCSWGELTEFRRIESGETYPDFDTWTAICQTFGWAQTL